VQHFSVNILNNLDDHLRLRIASSDLKQSIKSISSVLPYWKRWKTEISIRHILTDFDENLAGQVDALWP